MHKRVTSRSAAGRHRRADAATPAPIRRAISRERRGRLRRAIRQGHDSDVEADEIFGLPSQRPRTRRQPGGLQRDFGSHRYQLKRQSLACSRDDRKDRRQVQARRPGYDPSRRGRWDPAVVEALGGDNGPDREQQPDDDSEDRRTALAGSRDEHAGNRGLDDFGVADLGGAQGTQPLKLLRKQGARQRHPVPAGRSAPCLVLHRM